MIGSKRQLNTERYLRADKLRPGDVFLSRGSGKESDWIARGTFGPYSHASIYLGHYFVFESIDAGVGYTRLEIMKACRNPRQARTIILDASHYENLEIRRHPFLENEASNDIADALVEILVPSNGREYPPVSALAKTVPFVPALIVGGILRLVTGADSIRTVPGLFCSQLVAVALDELGAYPLKKDWLGRKIEPEKVSPNRLRSQRSLLELVPDAIVGSDFPCESAMDEEGLRLVAALKEIQDQREGMAHRGRAQELLKNSEALRATLERWAARG